MRPRRPQPYARLTPALLSGLAAIAALAFASAVQAGDTTIRARPFQRLLASAPGEAPPATATLARESRPVLAAYSRVRLSGSATARVSSARTLAIDLPLSAPLAQLELREGDPLLLVVRARMRKEKEWHDLGYAVAAVQRDDEQKLRVRAEVSAPPPLRSVVHLWIEAIAIQPAARHRVETEALPAGAELRFATGVDPAAASLGAVRFRVRGCRADDCRELFSQVLEPASAQSARWYEHRVSLADYAGGALRLELDAAPVDEASSGSLPYFANPVIFAPSDAAAPPNLILVSLDTLGARHMSAYGYPRATTPFLGGELAARGTLFERHYANASSTAPSHMTLFTSLLPSVHQTTENTKGHRLSPALTTLPEVLQRSGYVTLAVTENGAIDRARGFGRGFDRYYEFRDVESEGETPPAEPTFERAGAWLEERGGEPFFLFLHTYQVHNPFHPPLEYQTLFRDDHEDLRPPPEIRANWNPAQYDREIRYLDDQLRALVSRLDAAGLLANTHLVLTSDHGEQFLEHGFIAHGADIHDEILHVPLLFVGPGVPAGRRVDATVSLVDLAPTVLELLDISPPAQASGHSFAALVRGAEPEPAWNARPHYSEAWQTRAFRARTAHDILQPSFAVRVGQRKLLRYRDPRQGHRYEYYDLSTDPHEANDLYATDPTAAADLKALLDTYEARAQQQREDLLQGTRPEAHTIHPDDEEKLRALGYID